MNRNSLLLVIALTLLGFILFQGVASLLCDPKPSNSVAKVLSESIATSKVDQNSANQDPLSWEPVLQRIASYLSKACPRN